jgi:putative ATP-binding cassette transporter
LLTGVDVALQPGDRALIQGPSGSGKTTLLRALAGLWPYTSGEIVLPEGLILHLSQKPYLPMGTLREALFYPHQPDDRDLQPTLAALDLNDWADKLHTVADWTRILSLGEQQRVAFVRALLARPAVIFLDESTSAMGEAMQAKAYDLLKTALPSALIISVGHRASLLDLHNVHWTVVDQTLQLGRHHYLHKA